MHIIFEEGYTRRYSLCCGGNLKRRCRHYEDWQRILLNVSNPLFICHLTRKNFVYQ